MNAAAPNNAKKTFDPDGWVDAYGDYLYRFAFSVVKDPVLAEELVQETFVGALRSLKGFRGRSSERTWLVAILKNKIVDHFRTKSKRESVSENIETYTDHEQGHFTGDGRWSIKPGKWTTDPLKLVVQKQFIDILYYCISELPERLAKAFMMREIEGLSTKEICKALDITATNSWVMLYRARMALRQCLEKKWMSKTVES